MKPVEEIPATKVKEETSKEEDDYDYEAAQTDFKYGNMPSPEPVSETKHATNAEAKTVEESPMTKVKEETSKEGDEDYEAAWTEHIYGIEVSASKSPTAQVSCSAPEPVSETEEVDIDLNDPEVEQAAIKIQAGFKGMQARREVKQKREVKALMIITHIK